MRLQLTLQEIATGVTKKIKVTKMVPCSRCKGKGIKEGSSKQTVLDLPRDGRAAAGVALAVRAVREHPDVPVLPGRGIASSAIRAPRAAAKGAVEGSKNVEVKIPAGVATGNYIRLEGQGDAGPAGGPAGDLIILIEEIEDEVFERHGYDIVCDLPVSFAQLALGARIEIPTLDGTAAIKIPAGNAIAQDSAPQGEGHSASQFVRQGGSARAPRRVDAAEHRQGRARGL